VQTAESYYLVSEQLGIAWLQQSIRTVAREDVWEKRLSQQLLAEVGRSHRAVSRSLLECAAGREIPECLLEFEETRGRETAVYREVLDELKGADEAPLAGYAVAVQALAQLAEG
jgi:NAD-specific glutamate dehydrogenase